MKAVVLEKIGGAEELIFKEVLNPIAGAGEVVVKLKSAALNHRDVWIRLGQYAGIKLPIILGSDGAGIVESVGDEVDKNLIGQEIIIDPATDWGNDEKCQSKNYKILGLPDDGTYAERVKINAKNIFPKPNYLNFFEAGALALASLTAFRATIKKANVKENENVLVTGIGGGVALAALQIANSVGANVFVTSAHDGKIEKAKLHGAVAGANYKNENYKLRLQSFVNENGFDVVIDGTGGKVFDDALDLLKPGGRLVIYGATLGAAKDLQIRKIFWKQISIFGSTMGSVKDFSEMLNFFEAKKIHPVIDSIFQLKDAPLAHKKMEDGNQFGKIVLEI